MSKLAKDQKLKELIFPEENNDAIKMVVLIIVSVFSTFFLIFIEETILPWPWLVEELVKAAVIFFLILPMSCATHRLIGTLAFALMFALSENIFYFLNFINNNELGIYWQRFVWPLAMHLLTSLVILASVWKNKNWWLVGLLLAMAIHYLYNARLVFYLGF